jgi:hypothetical protein
MLMVAEKVPATSEIVPIISIYLTIVMSFTSLSVIMSVIVSHIHEKSKTCISKDQRLPKIMKLVFITYLAKLFRMEKSSKQLLKTIVKLHKKGITQAAAALNSKEPNVSKILNSDQSTDEISSNNNQTDGCKDKLFKKIARDFIKARNEKIKTKLYSNYYGNNSDDKFKKLNNKQIDYNVCSYHFDSNQNITTYSLDNNKNDTLSLETENGKSPIWLKRMELARNQMPSSPTNISNDLYFNNKFSKIDFMKQRKRSSLSKNSIKKNDLSDSNELSDTISVTKSIKKSNNNNNNTNNDKNNQSKKVKKKVIKNYRVRKENLSLYYAYEWILAGLVLDRLFFWIYLTATIISYITTLYIFPALVQQDKIDSMIFVP